MEQNKQPQENSAAKAGILSINGLSYSLSPDLSVVTSRTNVKQFFTRRAYTPGSTMVAILNTGASYIYGGDSFLVLDVSCPDFGGSGTNKQCTFGSGTAANLIQRITVLTRSGQVVERVEKLNQLAHTVMHYTKPTEWFRSVGQAAGYNRHIPADGATIVRFAIPMSLISGLFTYEHLLPSALMSGLRIEIELAPGSDALAVKCEGTLAPTKTPDYTIVNCHISVDSYQITDSCLRQLNAQASSGGMEVVFNTYHNSLNSRANTQLNIECRKAVSRGLMTFIKTTDTRGFKADGSTDLTTYAEDPMKSTPITSTSGLTSYQFQAGSLYWPNSQVTGETPEILAPEAFSHTLRAFKRYTAGVGPFLTYEGYVKRTDDEKKIEVSQNVVACDLERTYVQSLSGIPLSNSRSLAFNATYADKPTTPLNVSFFLCYTTLVRVFVSNATIEI